MDYLENHNRNPNTLVFAKFTRNKIGDLMYQTQLLNTGDHKFLQAAFVIPTQTEQLLATSTNRVNVNSTTTEKDNFIANLDLMASKLCKSYSFGEPLEQARSGIATVQVQSLPASAGVCNVI